MTTAATEDLQSTLRKLGDEDLATILTAIARSSKGIAALCRRGNVAKVTTQNAFGDEQLEIDVAADRAITAELSSTGLVRIASSEERPTEEVLCATGRYVVVYDPLDGSSIIGSNFAVGTIVGVWKGERVVGQLGDELLAAAAVVYGPRTTMYVGARNGVTEVTLVDDAWVVTDTMTTIGEGKLFAPANLRASQDHRGYKALMEHYMSERYTLRYTGGMVPDVVQLLVKRQGVFVSPVSERAPAKLRLVYEALPMAFLVECAGGASSDGTGSLLKRRVRDCEERTAVCVGSRAEVRRFEQFCGGGEQRCARDAG